MITLSLFADLTVEGNERGINWGHKLAAMKLAKECNEGMFKLLYEAPTVIYVNSLHLKLEELQKGISHSEQQLREIKYILGIEYQNALSNNSKSGPPSV